MVTIIQKLVVVHEKSSDVDIASAVSAGLSTITNLIDIDIKCSEGVDSQDQRYMISLVGTDEGSTTYKTSFIRVQNPKSASDVATLELAVETDIGDGASIDFQRIAVSKNVNFSTERLAFLTIYHA